MKLAAIFKQSEAAIKAWAVRRRAPKRYATRDSFMQGRRLGVVHTPKNPRARVRFDKLIPSDRPVEALKMEFAKVLKDSTAPIKAWKTRKTAIGTFGKGFVDL